MQLPRRRLDLIQREALRDVLRAIPVERGHVDQRNAVHPGSIAGQLDLPYKIDPLARTITFAGTAQLTSGTGAYRGITGGALTVHDHNTLDGQHGVLSVTGKVRYHG